MAKKDISTARCAKVGCKGKKGLKPYKDGKKYCPAHMPGEREKFKRAASEGGKKGAKARRMNAVMMDLGVEGNKGSVIAKLIEIANFYGKGLKLTDRWRAQMTVNILFKLHEFCTESSGDMEMDNKIKEIMESDLPDMIKLSQVASIVGPKQAMEITKFRLTSDAHAEETIDGIALLQEGEKGGKEPVIGRPDTLEHMDLKDLSKDEKKDEAEDIPDLDLPGVKELPEGEPDSEDEEKPAKKKKEAPEPVLEPVPENPEERKTRCNRQANELLGLYRKKVSGIFRKPEEIGQIFFQALYDKGVPFNALQQRVLFPRSQTDQPEMMIKSVEEDQNRQKGQTA